MDQDSNNSRVHKALIAPARHSDGPTLYLICEQAKANRWEVHEHLPDGRCLIWPELLTGPQQAEAAIYGWPSKDGSRHAPASVEQ